MKHLIAIAFTFFSISLFAQGKFDVQGDLAPTGAYGIVKARNLKGGYLGSVHDTVARNLIPITYRDSNTMVFTRVDSTMWILKGGLTNDYWSVFSTGGSGVDTSKVPYTGATRAVDLGSYDLTAAKLVSGNTITAGRRYDVGTASNFNGLVRMYNSTNSFYTTLSAGVPASNVTVTMPNSSGTLALTSDVPNIDTTYATGVKTNLRATNDSAVLAAAINAKTGRVYAGNGLVNVNDSTLRTDTSTAIIGTATVGYALNLYNILDGLKLSKSDTAAMLSKYRDTLNSHNSRIITNTQNIATNTSNIALKLNITDSTIYSTKANGTKQRDSVQANLTAGIALKLNASDSSLYALRTPDANVRAASYTLVLSDAGKFVEINNASANTLTIPPNSGVAFPIGTVITGVQRGAGITTITAGSGVTITSFNTWLRSGGQYAYYGLRKTGTNTWDLFGNIMP